MSYLRYLALLLFFLASSVMAYPLVIVVESYHPENAWDKAYLNGLRSKLDGVAELDFIALDTKRLPTSAHLEQADLAFYEIQQKKPDLVVLGDDAALALLGPRLARMKMPVVFLGVNADPAQYFGGKLPASITGVIERPLYQQNFNLIRELLPQAKNILVLLDQDRSASFLQADIQRLKHNDIDVVLVNHYSIWKNKVMNANLQYDAIVLGTYQALIGADGQHVDADEVMSWTRAHSPVPIFSFWDVAISRQGAAGGMVLSGFEHGAAAGTMARALLQQPRQVLPVQQSSPGHLIFSRAQAHYWKIQIPRKMSKRVSWLP
ncbi:ABC transporter substrate-binding protein [uncultured Deefgea sp.]|uniref:ABC transporter substrate-binding protein n=1 Tax=uncultured Deefgea sp. TaxID=1304914 RepID=UPI00260BFCF2|nr:ABC transporter substrate binding protein [uncultured Deefgea sp.]